ncbi:MAG: response regulator [Verrucomicrobia bacterium]|nr:response regulator [Verrucomicrobiota bacterium]
MAKHSKRILVADDEESIRRLREYNLRKFGFEPVLVKNGSEAILAASDDLTCVLVDLKMPEVGGLAVLEHLKKAHPDVPVIIMSIMVNLAAWLTPYAKASCKVTCFGSWLNKLSKLVWEINSLMIKSKQADKFV